jgi:serine/threonine protein kinase
MRDYEIGAEPVPGYQIIRPLGAGGYGTVWVARSPGDVEIALKIINLQGQGLKEFRALGLVKKLRHPNLIPIYAFWLKDEFGNFIDSSGQDSVNLRGRSSELIIAMGLGDKSLSARLEECKKEFAARHSLPDNDAAIILKVQELGGSELAGIPIEELLEYMSGAARAIDYLNQPTHTLVSGPPSAIQHCDIKPGNLLIVSGDVQVCDYGLARVTDDARKTQAAGTPAYMAPELLGNKPAHGTDQYSLAITYYELRTGKLPFEEQLAFHAHITGQLDFGLVTPMEQEILRKATQMRPVDRYPHTSEMVRALKDVLTPSRPATSVGMPAFIPPTTGSPLAAFAPTAPPPTVSSTPSGVYRSGSTPHNPAVAESSTPTIISKPLVLDDLIRAGYELVPGHKLEQLLGRGGYGEVWSATMPGKTRCALKIVRNLDAVQGKQEFKSLDMIRELDHDRLIRLQAYWVLAFDGSVIPDDQLGQAGAPKACGLVVATDLANQNLLQRWQECHDQGTPGIAKEELVPYIRQSAEAIDYLNFQEPSIVHRDIKPENILLTKDHRVKVSDFGLAKIVEGSSAAINAASVGMTLAYAAPEMFRNTVTRYTDQYSLAVTYYRLRVGKLPFEEGLGPIQMMQAHASGTLDFSGVPDEEQAVLRRACAVKPEERFNRCLEFVEALEVAAGVSRPLLTQMSMANVSMASIGSGRLGQSMARLGGTGSGGGEIRETLRFEDVNAPGVTPAGWPKGTPAAGPRPVADSGEFNVSPEPKRLGGLPMGLMETTTNIPSSSDLDTAPDGSKTGWKTPADSAARKRSTTPIIAALALALIAAIGGAYYFGHRGGMTTITQTSGTQTAGTQTSGTQTVDTGKKVTPSSVDDVAELRRKTEQSVTTALAGNDFAVAARSVRDAAGKAGAEWSAKQDERIVEGWREFADSRPDNDQKIAEFGKLLAVYPKQDVAKSRLAVLTFERDNRKVAGLFSESLGKLRAAALGDSRSKLGEAQAELDRLAKETATPEAQAHINTKRAELEEVAAALTDLQKLGDVAPSESAVADLGKKVGSMKAAGVPEYQGAIREAYRHALGDKIEQLVPNLGDKTKWETLLAACRSAAPVPGGGEANPWAALCRLECAAELTTRGQPGGTAADRSAAAVSGNSAALAAYAKYATAINAWAAKPGAKDAAQALAALAPDAGESPAAQLNDYRRGRVLAELRNAVGQLRGSEAMAPFAGAAADATPWLAAATRLAEKDASVSQADLLRLKFDLLLAQVAGPSPPWDKMRSLAEELAPAAAQKVWQPSVPEKVLLWAAFARTREPSPAGRLAAVRGYTTLLETLAENLGGVPADYLYATVVHPLAEDGGRQIIGDKPEGAAAGAAARLYFLAARNVRRYADAWAAQKDLSDRDRLQLIIKLFERAAELDKRPEFTAWVGIAKGEIPGADVGSSEGLTDDSVPAVALLRGIVLVSKSGKDADLSARVGKWREADGLFRTGIERCAKRPEFRDELVLLYQRAANNCIQLANAILTVNPVGGRGEMSQYLDDAKGFADSLLKLDSGRLEVYDTRGCAFEDMAWLRKDADRLGEKGEYAQAIDDFTTATGGLGARAAAFMHLGRCKFKWVEDVYYSAKPAARKLDEEQLNAADTSLDEVFSRTPESIEATESHYWKAKVLLLRAAADAGMSKGGLYIKAAAEFKRAAALAAKLKAAGWEEEALKAWAVAAQAEAARQADGKAGGVEGTIADAADRAEVLRKFSEPWCSYLKMELIELRERLQTVDLFDEYLNVSKPGLVKCREQDQPIQFLVRMKLVDLRTSILPSKSRHRRGAEALEDARAGLALAEKAKLGNADLAEAHGAIGMCWYFASVPMTAADREKAKNEFLEALRLAPAHWLTWKWKTALAYIRSVEPVKTVAEEATRFADTCRLFREAETSLSTFEAGRARLSSEQLLYKSSIPSFRAKTEDLAKSRWVEAINDDAQADNPDRTRWQLALAEMYSVRKTELPTARKMLADAETTVQKLPASEQAFYKPQIDRITGLLPKS